MSVPSGSQSPPPGPARSISKGWAAVSLDVPCAKEFKDALLSSAEKWLDVQYKFSFPKQKS